MSELDQKSIKRKKRNFDLIDEEIKNDPVISEPKIRLLYNKTARTENDIKKIFSLKYRVYKCAIRATAILEKKYIDQNEFVFHEDKYNEEIEPKSNELDDFDPIDFKSFQEQFIIEANKFPEFMPNDFWKDKEKDTSIFFSRDNFKSFKRHYGHVLSNFIGGRFPEDFQELFKFIMKMGDNQILSDAHEDLDVRHIESIFNATPTNRPQDAHATFKQYVLHTSAMWRMAVYLDEAKNLTRVSESLIGNPYRIRFNGRLISQDLARSVTEYNLLSKYINSTSKSRVLEIGAGYGRLGEVFHQLSDVQYIIVDIMPSIFVSRFYLERRHPKSKILDFRDIAKIGRLPDNFEEYDFIFLTPNQLKYLPDESVDMVININSFMEMSWTAVDSYFSEIDRLSNGFLYTKQWFRNLNKKGVELFSKRNYPIKEHWKLVREQRDQLHIKFFEQIWKLGG